MFSLSRFETKHLLIRVKTVTVRQLNNNSDVVGKRIIEKFFNLLNGVEPFYWRYLGGCIRIIPIRSDVQLTCVGCIVRKFMFCVLLYSYTTGVHLVYVSF